MSTELVSPVVPYSLPLVEIKHNKSQVSQVSALKPTRHNKQILTYFRSTQEEKPGNQDFFSWRGGGGVVMPTVVPLPQCL